MPRYQKGVREMTMDHFVERIAKDDESGCWLWTGNDVRAGYGTFFLDGRNQRAHRLAFEYFVGPIPPGAHICHHCDNKKCVNPKHLYPGTDRTNVHDMIAKGRRVVAGRKPNTLQKHDVIAIIDALHKGESAMSIAKRYGVTWPTIGNIKHARSWQHLRRPWISPPQSNK